MPFAVKALLHALFWPLLLVWIIDPKSPSHFYRNAALSIAAVLLLPLAVGAWRQSWVERTRGAMRFADIVAVNLALLLLFAEGGLRLLSALSSSPLFAPPQAEAVARLERWRGRPGAEQGGRRYNALGYLDVDFEPARQPGVRRVVALADSFGVGPVPYAANFLTRLDELLDARLPTEVLNFAVVAIGPREYLQVWRDEAAAYHPDLVLLCLFVGNDIQKYASRSLFHREVLMLYAVPRRLLSLAAASDPSAGNAGEWGTFGEQEYLRVAAGRSKLCLREPPSDQRRAWRETLAVLEDLVREVGPRLRVAIIPDELQVSDPLFAAVTAGHEADYERERPQRVLSGFFAARGVPYLDLLPALRRAEAAGRTYLPRETHWNEHGHAVAAAAIAAWIDGAPSGKESSF